jgi:hypothetical protein
MVGRRVFIASESIDDLRARHQLQSGTTGARMAVRKQAAEGVLDCEATNEWPEEIRMSKHIEKLVAIKPDTRVTTGPARAPRQERVSMLLTPEEFAAATGISLHTVRIWVRQGLICSLPIGVTGRVRRIPVGEVERVRKFNGNGTAAPVQE